MREVEEAILARAPEHDLQPSLDRIAAVMELLGDPQRTYPVIHLTGTNGKTSTTRIIDTLLTEMGLRTGRFTSPHLHSVRERIALAGEPISRREVPRRLRRRAAVHRDGRRPLGRRGRPAHDLLRGARGRRVCRVRRRPRGRRHRRGGPRRELGRDQRRRRLGRRGHADLAGPPALPRQRRRRHRHREVGDHQGRRGRRHRDPGAGRRPRSSPSAARRSARG